MSKLYKVKVITQNQSLSTFKRRLYFSLDCFIKWEKEWTQNMIKITFFQNKKKTSVPSCYLHFQKVRPKKVSIVQKPKAEDETHNLHRNQFPQINHFPRWKMENCMSVTRIILWFHNSCQQQAIFHHKRSRSISFFH